MRGTTGSRRRSHRLRNTLLVVLPVFAILLVHELLITRIPDDVYTKNTMIVLERRIRAQAQDNDQQEISLDKLPEFPGYNNSIRDAWGTQFAVSRTSNTVTIISAGKDKRFGTGAAEDDDINHTIDLNLQFGETPLVNFDCDPPA